MPRYGNRRKGKKLAAQLLETFAKCMAAITKSPTDRRSRQSAAGQRRALLEVQGGAALLTREGEIITGANVESASYGLPAAPSASRYLPP